MQSLGWGDSGEAWKWRIRLFAWEEELLRESVTRLSNVVLQVMVLDRWIWKLHSSQRHTVKNAYKNLTVVDVDFNVDDNQVNIFIWHFLLNWIATKDNLVRRNIIAVFLLLLLD
jgi:hypothetical protein